MTDLINRITVDPDKMAGKPVIRGLRITVEQIIQALARGVSTRELLDDYPELETEDIHAVLAYAAQLIAEERVYPVKSVI